MNLPNSLTLVRIFLVPLLVVVLLTRVENFELWGAAILLGAALTDWLDGYLARQRRQVTTLGVLLDPIADKLLISSAFISLVEIGLVQAWMVVVVVGREFAVTGLRSVAALKGVAISAKRLGKYKMVSQVFCVGFLIGGKMVTNDVYFIEIGRVLLWLVVLLSLASMIQYFKHFWGVIETKERSQEESEADNVVRLGRKKIS